MNKNVIDDLSNKISKPNKPTTSNHVNKNPISCHRMYLLIGLL